MLGVNLSTENIVFIVVGIVCLLGCIPMFIWFWRSYKYPVSENELAYNNWFMSWLKKNKAAFLLLTFAVLLICGIAFIATGFGKEFVTPDVQSFYVLR